MFSDDSRSTSAVHLLSIFAATLFASCGLIALNNPAVAQSFNINGPTAAAQILGPGSGQTGVVTTTGALTVAGSTVAVTISGIDARLTNNGTINQTGTGRVIRDSTGVTNLNVTNNLGALMQTADADVFQMNKTPASVTLNNFGSMTSLNASKGGAQAVDFAAILSGNNTINNFSTGIMQAADADAVRPGVNGIVFNAGSIKSTSSAGLSVAGINVQKNSGVQVTNDTAGVIEGSHHGFTGGALISTDILTLSVTNKSGGIIKGNDGSGINIAGFNANEIVTVVNDGSIIGNGITGDGDGIDVDGLINLNNSGLIKSLNSFSSTTSGQSEGVTVGGGTIINSGTIEGAVDPSNTNATGRGITLAGVVTTGPAPIYGTSIITNKSGGLIKGKSAGIVVGGAASGFTVTITNETNATIEGGGSNSATIKTSADNDTINNAGIIKATSSGKAIDMGDGNNILNIFGGAASIIGDINGGLGGANIMTIDPGIGNAFTYSGSISNFNAANIKSGLVSLDGINTYTGTTSIDGGALRLAIAGILSSTIIINTGATFEQSGTIGGDGDGVNVHSGGNYYVTSPAISGLGTFSGSNQFLQLQSDSNSYFDIGGTTRGTRYDYIAGLASFILPTSGVPAHFRLNYLGSYSPIIGDTFDLIDWTTTSPSAGSLFDFTSAPTGFMWDTSNFLSNGRITLGVPEPNSLFLSIVGMSVLCSRIRRRSE